MVRDIQRIQVKLTDEEVRMATEIGLATQKWAKDNNIKDQETADPSRGSDWHITGALCEKAASKATGLPWKRELGNFKKADVGPHEVRATTWTVGKLRLNMKGTKPEKAYILVVDQRPFFTLAGWLWAEEGMKPKYWGNHYGHWNKPCWGIPQEDLRPISTLPEILAINLHLVSPDIWMELWKAGIRQPGVYLKAGGKW